MSFKIINCPTPIVVHLGQGHGIGGFGFAPDRTEDRTHLLAISLTAIDGNATGIYSITTTNRMPTAEELSAQGRPAVPSMAGECTLIEVKGESSFKLVVNGEHEALQNPRVKQGGITRPISLKTYALAEGEGEWIQGPNLEFRLNLKRVDNYSNPFAIDLGTTNSCAAFMSGAPPTFQLYRFDKETSVPSVVLYQPANASGSQRHVTIGRDVFRMQQEIPIRSFKRYMGNNRVRFESEHVSGKLTPQAVYTDFVRTYLRGFESEHAARLRRVSATFPPDYSLKAKGAVKSVYEELGLETEKLLSVDEASAAAVYYIWERLNDCGFDLEVYLSRFGATHNLLVFDLGGGTADISLVRVDLSSGEGSFKRVALSVLGTASLLNVGGDNFTLAVLKAMKSRIAMTAAAGFRDGSVKVAKLSQEVQDGLQKLADNFSANEHLLASTEDDETSLGELDELVEQVIPTAWTRFEQGADQDVFARRNAYNTFHGLWREAEELKLQLVANDTLSLDPIRLTGDQEFLKSVSNLALTPAAISDISMSREQDLYRRIRPILRRAISACRQVATSSSGEMLQIDSIQLAGNSCNIELVRTMMEQEFEEDFAHINNMIAFNPEDAKTSVALGACIAAHLNDFGRQLPIRLVFDPIPEQLGWDIGSYEPPFKPFEPYFTADQQPSGKPEYILEDTGQIRVDLFRRRHGDTNPPEHLGHFLLDSFSRVIKGIPPVQNGNLLLVLTGPDVVKLRKGNRLFDLIPPETIESDTDDPFSGHH